MHDVNYDNVEATVGVIRDALSDSGHALDDRARVTMGESDALIRNVLSIMRNWERDAKIISGHMSRLAWLLDGWSYIVALWTSVENEPHERQRDTILEMARLIPVMPRV